MLTDSIGQTPPTEQPAVLLTDTQALLIQAIAQVTHVHAERLGPFQWDWVLAVLNDHEIGPFTRSLHALRVKGLVTRLPGGEYQLSTAALPAWGAWYRAGGYDVPGSEAMFG